jgi:predicted peptidase
VARPEVVAAIVPIASRASSQGICAMRGVAVWAFHGERDKDEKLEGEQRTVEALNACQPPPTELARLTVYPGAGHEVWSRTYDGSAGNDIYGWLLAHHRRDAKGADLLARPPA